MTPVVAAWWPQAAPKLVCAKARPWGRAGGVQVTIGRSRKGWSSLAFLFSLSSET